jgi:UDPglucose 6-dehydrogenase
MKISVIGSGYVGLVTAACLADVGHTVLCLDNNQAKIQALKKNIIPIFEPGLDAIVRKNVRQHRLEFSSDMKQLSSTDVIFIAVGTPPAKNGEADLANVFAVAATIGKLAQRPMVIVNKSTVPVGTAQKVEAIIAKELASRRLAQKFAVVSNPEFLKEGTAIKDFMKPDRIVIGSSSLWSTKIMRQIYAPFIRRQYPFLVLDRESAELSKYAANAMLASKISFMNEIANICEIAGGNIDLIREVLSLDPRIGNQFLRAGVGYGGSCFPKDVQALAAMTRRLGHPALLLEAVESVNNKQKLSLIRKISQLYPSFKNRRFAVWGLAFKPDTDDVREAPAIALIEEILKRGGHVTAYDPQAADQARRVLGKRVRFAKNKYDACRGADALLLVTEWAEFTNPNFKTLQRNLKNQVIVDGRNIYDSEKLRSLGFHYIGIGKR